MPNRSSVPLVGSRKLIARREHVLRGLRRNPRWKSVQRGKRLGVMPSDQRCAEVGPVLRRMPIAYQSHRVSERDGSAARRVDTELGRVTTNGQVRDRVLREQLLKFGIEK